MERGSYLERVRELLPRTAARAREAELLRRLPDESWKEWQELGLLRALQPARFGGFELDPWTLFEAQIELGTACGSSAWLLGVLGVHDWQLALFPLRTQEEVWGEDSSVQISSSYAPTGRVEPVSGGYRLSGTWEFSSGCDHCQWAFLGGLLRGEERRELYTFLVPRSDYEIEDNWQVVGLCATGSKNVVVADAFVPEHRTYRMLDGFRLSSPGQAVHRSPLYRLPFGCVFTTAIAAPAVGVARGALDAFRERTRKRVFAFGSARARDDPGTQGRLAEAASEIDAAYEQLRRTWAELQRLAWEGAEIPIGLRARCRFDNAKAIARCVHATNLLFEASGGHAIFLEQPIQRAWRDVHAIRAHAVNGLDRNAWLYARSELGLEPGDFFL